MDAVVLAVAHREFAALTETEISGFFGSGVKTLLDLKGLLDRDEYERAGYLYWRL
jgi:UDP-N-acetyl-D-galactosamine dehydrogenase